MKPRISGKIDLVLLDEVRGKLKHGNVTSPVAFLYECRQMVSCPYPHSIRAFRPVYTDTLPETLVVLIERTEKCFVFRTKPLKGIAYHFSRNERFPV